MQEKRKAWSNVLLATFCKKFRNCVPESFITALKRVSRQLHQLRSLQFVIFALQFFHQLVIAVGNDNFIELTAIV